MDFYGSCRRQGARAIALVAKVALNLRIYGNI